MCLAYASPYATDDEREAWQVERARLEREAEVRVRQEEQAERAREREAEARVRKEEKARQAEREAEARVRQEEKARQAEREAEARVRQEEKARQAERVGPEREEKGRAGAGDLLSVLLRPEFVCLCILVSSMSALPIYTIYMDVFIFRTTIACFLFTVPFRIFHNGK